MLMQHMVQLLSKKEHSYPGFLNIWKLIIFPCHWVRQVCKKWLYRWLSIQFFQLWQHCFPSYQFCCLKAWWYTNPRSTYCPPFQPQLWKLMNLLLFLIFRNAQFCVPLWALLMDFAGLSEDPFKLVIQENFPFSLETSFEGTAHFS